MLATVRHTMFALFSTLSLTPVAMAENPFRSFGDNTVEVLPEAQTREDVFASPRWSDVVNSMDEWISVQLIYTESQTAELVQGIKDKVDSLDVVELKAFLVDTEERLAVLLSDDAAKARRYLSVASQEYRQKLLARNGQIPNVFAVPVAQLRQELAGFQRQRLAAATANIEFAAARQQRADTIREDNLTQQQAIRIARSDAIRSAQVGRTSSRTQATPRARPQRTRSPQYVVSTFGSLFRLLP